MVDPTHWSISTQASTSCARWESRDSKDRDVIGGCYFFESVADVEAYLNSDFWLKCERETQWKEVVGEVFEIVP